MSLSSFCTIWRLPSARLILLLRPDLEDYRILGTAMPPLRCSVFRREALSDWRLTSLHGIRACSDTDNADMLLAQIAYSMSVGDSGTSGVLKTYVC